MNMRRRMGQSAKARMAAERDGFAILVAAIGIAASPVFKIDQRDKPWPDTDATELDRFSANPGRANRPIRIALMPLAGRNLRLLHGPLCGLRPRLATRRDDKSQPLAASERGAARIGSAEPRIERISSLRVRHTP